MQLQLALALLAAASPIYPDELDGLYAQLDRCVEAARTATEGSAQADMTCGYAVRTLIQKESVEESRLWQAFDAVPPDTFLRVVIANGLLDRRVELALSRLPDARAAEVVKNDATAEELLAQARATHKAVSASLEARLRSVRGDLAEIPYHDDRLAFETTLADYVRGGLSLKAAESSIARYVWGHWCGTGSGAMTGPQRALVILSALEDARWDAAAGSLGGWDARAQVWDLLGKGAKRKLLTLAGVDWELHEVGAALSGDPTAYRSLGQDGSDQAARLLIDAIETATNDAETAESGSDPAPTESDATRYLGQLLPTLAAFVTPEKGCGPMATSSIDAVRRVSSAIVPETTQQQILGILGRHVAATRGVEEAETASRLLLGLCRPESRDAFRTMLESPFGEVRKRGWAGLRALGDDPGPEPEAEPVQFQITVDGSPLASRFIAWDVEGARGSRSSHPQLDERGRFAINRDFFVDPTAPVERIAVSALLKEPTDVWFNVEIPPPTELGDVIGVSVRTQRLTVSLAGVSEAERAGLTLQLVSAGTEELDSVAMLESLAGTALIVFDRLQRGRRYRVIVSGPGDREWTSDEVLLDRSPAVIVVPR